MCCGEGNIFEPRRRLGCDTVRCDEKWLRCDAVWELPDKRGARKSAEGGCAILAC